MTHARKQPSASAVLIVRTRRLDIPGTEKLSHGITYIQCTPLMEKVGRLQRPAARLTTEKATVMYIVMNIARTALTTVLSFQTAGVIRDPICFVEASNDVTS